MAEPAPMPTEEERQELVPGYETDPKATGMRRTAVDPLGNQDWYEVHDLSADEAKALVEEYEL